MKKKTSIKEAYQKWAKFYDVEYNPLILIERGRSISALGNIKGKKILDVGCGTGRNTIKIAKMDAKVTGIDFSKEMLDKAKEKARRNKVDIEFIQMNVLGGLKFKSNSFDAIICNFALEHFKNRVPIIKEMKRILRHKGILIITEAHPLSQVLDPSREYFIGPNESAICYKYYISEYFSLFKKMGLELIDLQEFISDKKFDKYTKNKRWYFKEGVAIGVMYKLQKIGR